MYNLLILIVVVLWIGSAVGIAVGYSDFFSAKTILQQIAGIQEGGFSAVILAICTCTILIGATISRNRQG